MTTATIHPRTHHQSYPNFPSSITEPNRSHIPLSKASTLSNSDFPAAESPEDDDPPPLDPRKNRLQHTERHPAPQSSNMAARADKRPDWNKFYENGIPKEVIVIDDSSPEAPPEPAPRKVSGDYSKQASHHLDKRRRMDNNYDPVHQHKTSIHNAHDQSSSENTSQEDRTNSALYSTAPTSLTSTGSSNHVQQPLEQTRAGQKRKRSSRKAPENETPEPEPSTHTYNWSNYVPPNKPLIKAKDVYVAVVRDVSSRCSSMLGLRTNDWISGPPMPPTR